MIYQQNKIIKYPKKYPVLERKILEIIDAFF